MYSMETSLNGTHAVNFLQKKVSLTLTVLLPKFFTLQLRYAVLPTMPVRLVGTVVSKNGPVPGVGKSCRKSVRNFLVPRAPEERKQKSVTN